MVETNHTDNKSTKSQLYWNTLVRIPTQIASFIISIIVARILMPSDYGILAIAMMLIGYANLFTNFGFNQAIVQKKITDKRVLNSIFTLDLTISAILTANFFYLSGPIANFFRTPECKSVIQVMSFVFVITSFHALPHAILRRDMDFKVFSLIETSQALLMSVLTLILAIIGFRYWALAYGQLIPLVIIAIVLCIKTRWYPALYYSHRLMRGVYDFGVWNFLRSQLNFVSNHVDKFIIGRWISATSLGFYEKAMSISMTPLSSFTMNINAVMFSSFSRSQEDKTELQNQFAKSLSLISITHFPVYMGLIVIAPYFVYVLLGSKWAPMIVPFQIILAGCIFKSFGGLIGSLNVGVGKYRNHTIRLLISLLAFVISCILLLRFDLNGIASAFIIYCSLEFILTMSLARTTIDFSWRRIIHSILPGAWCSLVMFVIVKLAAHYYLNIFSITNMAGLILLGGIAYSLSFLVDRNKSSMELKETVLTDIKGRFLGLLSR